MNTGTTRRIPAVVGAALAAIAIASQAASAAVVNVHPGQDAIQRAIGDAHNGDTLRIHGGIYRESVEVNKRLTLKSAGDGRPVIDGRCDAGVVVDVQRNGVVLQDLKVVGARNQVQAKAVDLRSIERGTVRDLVLRDTCGAGPDEGAEYGVNVYNSERITVDGVNAKGFRDAGVYIGSIETTGSGRLTVRGNETFANNIGIIVEDVGPAAEVVVRENRTHDNGTGSYVNRSDDVLFRGNEITDNALGIDIDDQSDDNVFTNNTLSGNDSDLLDEGSGNCGSGNTPEIFDPC